MLIRDILRRENNNFELLRLIAASAVIIGHSKGIAADDSFLDIAVYLTGFDYLGALGVKFFFLLSGLVVTNSLILNPDLRRFVCARVFRIFPALAAVLVLTAFVIGPLFTHLPLGHYLADPLTSSYVFDNIKLSMNYKLPGVFETMDLKAVNGSIWTIPFEFKCYMLLAVIGTLGFSKNRWTITALIAAAGGVVLFQPDWLNAVFLAQNGAQMYLFFAIGALLAVWKDHVTINLEVAAGLAIAAFIFRTTGALPYLVDLSLFAFAIYLSTRAAVVSMRLPGDFSYGVYLIGWPLQQMVHTIFHKMGARGNWMVTLPLAIVFGALSWYAIEKPGIALGKRLGGKLPAPRVSGATSARQ